MSHPARSASRILSLAAAWIVFLALISASQAQNICWRGTSSVVPQDPLVPAQHRMVEADAVHQLSLVPALPSGSVLNVLDTVDTERVLLTHTFSDPLQVAAEWECTLLIQMHSATRFWGVDLGNVTHIHDEDHAYMLGIDDGGVGFVDNPTNAWAGGQFLAMDVSDTLHTFRMVATPNTVSLFIDGAAAPSLSLPKASFPTLGEASKVHMVATSSIAVADFDIAAFDFRRLNAGLQLEVCPSVAAAGDLLKLDGFDGMAGTPAALFLATVNGAPYFLPILTSAFDSSCEWRFQTLVPAGTPVVVLGFQLFGFEKPPGILVASNTASIALH